MMIKFFIYFFHFMLSVGFFMFMERKFLSLSHLREGPNKVLFKGYLQFLFDMFKLMVKFFFFLFSFNFFFYFIMPLILFINMLMMWIMLPFNSGFLNMEITILYLIVLLLFKMYFLVLMIFFIFSSYSYISMIRIVVQVISYDIIVILVFLFNFIIYSDFSYLMFIFNNIYFMFFVNIFIIFVWVMSVMVELIRLPFDFYEGESELISGFNVEYGSFLFLVLVLIEYMEIIYFIILTVFFFMYFDFNSIIFYLVVYLMVFFFIWFRVFFVRYRLDKMLILLWKFIFPFTMINIFFYYYLNLI
uniref:NADH dehydrogenase subunit 1 n=1 Tax=Ceroplastes floridensis TaxID=1182648 RepID=UPI00220DB0D8|nr:NADH dehydrogenase subunit 1 [Ceroplastes floridensis]UXW93685.1 NADH dehydrogenase subunit 1 [Ceroplastes floridensis]